MKRSETLMTELFQDDFAETHDFRWGDPLFDALKIPTLQKERRGWTSESGNTEKKVAVTGTTVFEETGREKQ